MFFFGVGPAAGSARCGARAGAADRDAALGPVEPGGAFPAQLLPAQLLPALGGQEIVSVLGRSSAAADRVVAARDRG